MAGTGGREAPDRRHLSVPRRARRYQVVRFAPKDFRQRRPNGAPDKWLWNMEGVEPLPYRLPDLLADPDATVFIPEGEKGCDHLGEIGLVATSNHGGAKKWRTEISRWLACRDVVLLPDNDDVGREHVQDVAQKVAGIAASVRILELPSLPPKGDVSNWLAQGGTADELERLAAAASANGHDQPTLLLTPIDPTSLVDIPIPPRQWLIPDWIPMARASSLYGRGGEGKTLLAQMLATA